MNRFYRPSARHPMLWFGGLLLCSLVGQHAAAQEPSREGKRLKLDEKTEQRRLEVLRAGLRSEDFWPSIHAAEGLTLGGYGEEVRRFLAPKLKTEKDDQRRCGIARELVRAGDRSAKQVMLDILAGDDPHGHVHAAESLYKVGEIGDGLAMRKAFAQKGSFRLRLMAAAALARCGNPQAMQALRKALSDPDPQVNHLAAWVLGRIGDKTNIARLRKSLTVKNNRQSPLIRAYHQHALAALGDAAGLAALAENLKHADPAVRTYAATFAGDARAFSLKKQLIAMLDDEHLDARIRAAQSLLSLSQPPPLGRRADISNIVFDAAPTHPRYTEGSILELGDGSLLFAATEFFGSGSDFAKARIVARSSQDGGRTWGLARVLQPNTGGMNVMSATLRRLKAPAAPNTIALFYLQKNSFDDLDLKVRFSTDEAKTFGEPVLVTQDEGYHVVNNDRITQLSSGRLIAPAASTSDVRKVNHFVSRVYFSDDGGKTWRRGKGQVDLPRRGAMEPEVIELRDGRLMMILRTQLGRIAISYSSDQGDTWGQPSYLSVKAPEAPAAIRRIPSTGDLLLIWNNTYQEGAGHGGKRTPLTCAVSSDEGKTWKHVRNLESAADRTFSYPSVAFVRDRLVLSYWDQSPEKGYSSRFRSLPVSWVYGE